MFPKFGHIDIYLTNFPNFGKKENANEWKNNNNIKPKRWRW